MLVEGLVDDVRHHDLYKIFDYEKYDKDWVRDDRRRVVDDRLVSLKKKSAIERGIALSFRRLTREREREKRSHIRQYVEENEEKKENGVFSFTYLRNI